ncbi:MAG: ChaN family lipoprotein [Deltaproteobacteria bacterium]|nr:ChaN family lipoprotein [Deltaproteobacteria bacterium]
MMHHRTLVSSVLVAMSLILMIGYPAAQQTPEYDLEVSFDIPASKIAGLGRIYVAGGKPVRFRTGRLTVRSVYLDRQPLDFQLNDGFLSVLPPRSGTLEIRYEGVFKPSRPSSDGRDGAFPSVIGPQGIFLASVWYPEVEELVKYRLKAHLPRGYIAVAEAETIQKLEQNGAATFIFEFPHPADGINFVATNRYQVTHERFRGIELSAYFFPEDQALARKYLEYTKRYIELYEKLLLPFPFKRFAVVENFLPTGYSMPTYTLLGQDVVRLPFIVETSLGHEILHQWFGNHVYSPEQGNWTEGLTTYLADHLYEEQKGEGWKYRKQILLDYTSYVRDENDFPLGNFTHRVDSASRVIGYGKAAMVFHMLRQMTGDDGFFSGLRRFVQQMRFQRASWTDLQNAFEKETGKSLDWFFKQWTGRKGLPELEIGGLSVERDGKAFVLSFDLAQNGELYQLDIPATVFYRSGDEKTARIRLEERKKEVRLELEQEPLRLVIDQGYDTARKLSEPEVAPILAGLLGAQKLIVVRPVGEDSSYQPIMDAFQKRGAELKAADSLKDAEIQSASLLALGKSNPLMRRLYGSVQMPETGFNLSIKKNPLNPAKIVGIVSTGSDHELKAAFPKIWHYGKYSALTFENGVNVSKTIEPSQSGIQRVVREETQAIDVSTLTHLSKVIESVATKKIVYVGESHDKFSHHELQLQVLQGLHAKNPKIAIGMEMFQKPFQKAIDDYIAGVIDERTFLKRSEYFKRWSIDYNLYKPVLDFARAQRLPVIALNLPREIVEKVSKGGIDSLSNEEKQHIPGELDLSDQTYRERLKEIFAAHHPSRERNFDFFYQAQVLWDETMAESVDAFFKENPDYRMVVLAGSGHLVYGSGIPKRSFRRNGFEYEIILSDAQLEKGIADFIVFPQPSKGATAPRLMVLLDEQNQTLRVAGFSKDSVSEKAGLQVEDVILSLDGHPTASIEDVKIALLYKKTGEPIKVKVKRRGFFYGEDELEFEVKVQ